MTIGIALKYLRKGLSSKDKFYNSVINRAIRDKSYKHVL